jgi:SAM-dependent methyltransferase
MWRQGAARRAETLALANERLLEAAGLQPGMRVLDIAAGTGDQSLLAAERVGPTGSVLATDISPTMLAAAAEAAKDKGLPNIETLIADASALAVPAASFDAAICRFGLMFVPDLHQALSRIRAALRNGGRFATLVWSSQELNPWMGMQLDTVSDLGCMPSPAVSIGRALSLGEPGSLERSLTAAGFSDVHTERISTPRAFGSLDEAWQTMQTASPAQAELTRAMDDAQREVYRARLKQRLAAFLQGDGGCLIPGEAILGAATK